MPWKRYRRMVVAVLSPFLVCACSSGGSRAPLGAVGAATTTVSPVGAGAATTTAGDTSAATATGVATTVPTTPRPVPHPSSAITTAAIPFTYTVTTVTASSLPFSWRPGCPVPPSELRLIHMTYWGFDSRPHLGSMVLNASVVAQVVNVFRSLYEQHFSIFEMVPVDAYHGDDDQAAAADDTSGFNCRYAVAPGPPQWSVHAYGEAIDVNDVQNPYVDGSTIIPPAGRGYLDRADLRPGMAEPGGALVDAFTAVGWKWGGRWYPGTDYQHFSLTGG